jgi:hypothetical protein
MTCQQLAARIESLDPTLSPCDVARLCLLVLNQKLPPESFETDEGLEKVWRNSVFRLELAADQHAAVSEELESFGVDGPVSFSPDQLWMLLRAVKVQSQILDMYIDQPSLV